MKGIKIKLIGFLIVGCMLASCIKSFVPDIDEYEDLLVVDGMITDAPGPYKIRLSRSSRLEQKSKFIPYSKCLVQIKDDIGNTVTLKEYPAGEYITDSTAMQGFPGRKYKLAITTPEGDKYESAEELLVKGLGIQSVYGELQKKSDPKLFNGRDGYQFYVDAETPAGNENYLLWRLQCTYKFNADLSIKAYYDDGYLHQVFYSDSLKTCYKTVDILNLFLMNTKEQQKAEIKRIPLNYEDNYTKALSIRYSLKVTQFTLDEKSYTYWRGIKKISDDGGELYTQQPYQIKNNLKNLTNPSKPALGYFMVAGVSEKRIFVDVPPIVFRYDVCTMGDEKQNGLLEKFRYRPELWPVFFADRFGGIYYIDQACVDCRKTGTQTRPSFWID